MRALTLHQPWAGLVACGAKKHETRSWRPGWWPGRALAIHSSLASHAQAGATENPLLLPLARDYAYPGARGCILAIVRVGTAWRCSGGSELFSRGVGPADLVFGDYRRGRYAWPLEVLFALPEPVGCRGRQKIWTIQPDLLTEVVRQAARAGIDTDDWAEEPLGPSTPPARAATGGAP